MYHPNPTTEALEIVCARNVPDEDFIPLLTELAGRMSGTPPEDAPDAHRP